MLYPDLNRVRIYTILLNMPFLDDFRIDISSDIDDDLSDSKLAKPRGRGKAREWNVLHACATLEEYKAKLPSLEVFISRNKAKTLNNGIICIYQCKIKNCDYFLRCMESRLLIEYSGKHAHAEEEELHRKRGLTREQRSLIDRCISMNIRGGKSIATEFITYNDDLLKCGKPPLQIPNYRRISHYVDHTVNKENGRTADLTLGKLKGFIEAHFPDTLDDDTAICLHQAYNAESLSFQVLSYENLYYEVIILLTRSYSQRIDCFEASQLTPTHGIVMQRTKSLGTATHFSFLGTLIAQTTSILLLSL